MCGLQVCLPLLGSSLFSMEQDVCPLLGKSLSREYAISSFGLFLLLALVSSAAVFVYRTRGSMF
jgi:hypothetical protein